jgi:hypothetical protein
LKSKISTSIATIQFGEKKKELEKLANNLKEWIIRFWYWSGLRNDSDGRNA